MIEKPPDLFNHNQPLKEPKQRTSEEEFLFCQAKLRPVILIAKAPVYEEIKEVRKGHKFYTDLWLSIPVFSIISPISEKPRFKADTIENTRLLKFTNLFFLPSYSSFIKDSIARIDYIFPIRSSFLTLFPLKLVNDSITLLHELLYSIIVGYVKPDSIIEASRSLMFNLNSESNK